LIALIVADGDIPERTALERLLPPGGPDLIVAADGGALKASALGFVPHVVVGDADSLSAAAAEEMRRAGAEVIVYPAAKDESDTELALRMAVERGATELLVVGAFGGARLEHTIANLLLLCLPELAGRAVRLADDASVVRLLTGPATVTVDGEVGDLVSLLALTPLVEGVTTTGLAYPLNDEPLHQGPARGLSNVITDAGATVSARNGRLLLVHTRSDR
jgi:thiamine pyrophosphokinase